MDAPDLRPVGVAAPLTPWRRPEADPGGAPRLPYTPPGPLGPEADSGADMRPVVAGRSCGIDQSNRLIINMPCFYYNCKF